MLKHESILAGSAGNGSCLTFPQKSTISIQKLTRECLPKFFIMDGIPNSRHLLPKMCREDSNFPDMSDNKSSAVIYD
jgi:hypothetical protein